MIDAVMLLNEQEVIVIVSLVILAYSFIWLHKD